MKKIFLQITILFFGILFFVGGISQSEFEIQTQRTSASSSSSKTSASGCKPISKPANYEKCLYNKTKKIKKTKFLNI